MSRSYKKHAIVKDGQPRHRSKAKTMANRAVRKSEMPSGRAGYKKVYCSYDISDWRFIGSEIGLKKAWENGDEYLHKKFKNYQQALWAWRKEYKRK